MGRSGQGPAPGEPASADVAVTRIGADGDGVGVLPGGGPAYIPYALPGETVRTAGLTRRGEGWASAAFDILTASPDRQPAPCSHFGLCGGCTLQHWQDAPYAAWKSSQLAAALARAGFGEPAIQELARTPPHTRRRVDLALGRVGGAVRVGLHARRSNEVTDLQTCLVIHPDLVQLITALRRILPGLDGLRRTGSALANRLDSGIDLLLRTDAHLSAADRTALARLADGTGAARITWALGDGPPETASQLRPATISLAGVDVAPPPGAFLQASPAGEAAIVAAVVAGLPARLRAKAPIVELFAGCGTLTLALARHGRVIAYEGIAESCAALRRAAAGRPIQAMHRDLARQPLAAKEFAGAAAIVLDPPFAGAAAQMPGISAAGIDRVIYVSCNPAALARDARMLREAGYTVASATPIDQFLWSAGVESVTIFAKPPRPGRA